MAQRGEEVTVITTAGEDDGERQARTMSTPCKDGGEQKLRAATFENG